MLHELISSVSVVIGFVVGGVLLRLFTSSYALDRIYMSKIGSVVYRLLAMLASIVVGVGIMIYSVIILSIVLP